MRDPSDRSTSQERYGLLLLENPGSLVMEENPRRPVAGPSVPVALVPRPPAERFALAGFAVTYLATFGWFALRAVRWLIDG